MLKPAMLTGLALLLAQCVFAQELKVLTIGNSFANSVFGDLPKIAASVPDCKLRLEAANIGGCSLERHWNEIRLSNHDPAYKPYRKKYTLKELLTMEKWDIVTVQQASPLSYKPETFEPFLKELAAYIHTYAPRAEIVLQMTWSYHPAHRLYKRGPVYSPEEMFAGIEKTYRRYSAHYKFRVIPSGLAIQLARRNPPERLPEPSALARDQVEGADAVDSPNYFTVIGKWKEKDGKKVFRNDLIHLDKNGRYLQSCVWFAELFGRNPEEIRYTPDSMTEARARYFRSIAREAVEQYRRDAPVGAKSSPR